MTIRIEGGRVGEHIRATHPYGYRSGEWALIAGRGQDGPREFYWVRFDDGDTDVWVVHDPADPYEFKP